MTDVPSRPEPPHELPSEPPPELAPELPAPTGSRAWLGVLAVVVVMALLAGATAVLFVRVQQAQERADDAVVLAGSRNDALGARLADLDATLASAQASLTTNGDDVDALRRQVSALRKCVNTALDVWSAATQAGKPAAITKC